MRRVSVLFAVALLLTSIVGVPIAQAKQAPASPLAAGPYTAGRYIVTFADEPLATYDGYKKGFPATRPKAGQKLNPVSAAAVKWQKHLTAQHDAALAKVGAKKIYDYTVTNNGVAVKLTARQATKLAATKGVIALSKDRLSKPDTTLSPRFLGLDAPGVGLWSKTGGATNPGRAGAGVIVGVLDTGIWPESPSFAGGTGIPVPATWRGKCEAGEQFNRHNCNDKLIGARYYLGGFGVGNISTRDFVSPRDGDGHGSHTASTAAGNRVTGVAIDGKTFDEGIASGMAPGAKIAAYKVCWEGKKIAAGCFSSDSVAAINDAVADGVDVLNFSIGGGSESDALDSVAQAFRGASNAGVFVANSAGNSGPGASTLDHPAPWVTTVAAATHRRSFQAVELGNGARYVGASTTASIVDFKPFASSVSVKIASATNLNASLCAPGTLDPAKTAGKIIQCDRGVVDRIAKSAEVKRAGGVGMVMTNREPNSINGDYHLVPSVHVVVDHRQAIIDYTATAGATAKIVPLNAAELAAAPQVPEIAAFSSRGPSTTTDGDILKPDIAAPGVDVLAAVAPPFHFGRQWDLISGTSMASPHIAGIGALMKAAHPTWLPSEIKSALMTTARDTWSQPAPAAQTNTPFDQGAGFVDPNPAWDPGLVYPTTANEYRRYMVTLGVVWGGDFAFLNASPISASNLNQPAIAIGKFAGTETVTRRVKNVGTESASYSATASVPGFAVETTPSSFTLAPGAEQTFTVKFTLVDETAAPLGEWAFGSLTWTGGGHVVRSTVALEPVAVSAPAEVHTNVRPDGSTTFDIIVGSTSPVTMSVSGLVGVTPIADSVTVGAFDDAAPVADSDTKLYDIVVPADTKAARFSVDAVDNAADLDLYVYFDGERVALSASGAADEQVTLLEPDTGTYKVYVNGFAGNGAYSIANFVVPSTPPAGNLTLLPNPVTPPAVLGQPSTVTATWTGLEVTKRWFGVISYSGSDVVTYFSAG